MLELFKTKKSVALICAVSLLLSSIIAAIPLTASADKNAESTPEIWGGKNGLDVTAVEYAGGDGSEANPYLIENGDQLYKAAYAGKKDGVNISVDKYYRLENDIYLNDVSNETWYKGTDLNEWVKFDVDNEIGSFRGHFDGNGYVVHGIYYKDTTSEYAALFPKLDPYEATSVTVKNVGIEDSYIQGKDAGAITAVVDGNRDGNHTVNISCCYADESVFLKGTEANGFVAFLFNYYFTMDNCASRVRMIGTARTDEPIGSLLGAMYLLGTENGATNVDNAKKITIKNSYAVIQKEDRDNGFSVVPQSWTGRHVRYENVHAGVYPDNNGNSIKEGTNFTLNNQESCIFTRWPSDFRKTTLLTGFSDEIWLPGDGANTYMIPKVFDHTDDVAGGGGGDNPEDADGIWNGKDGLDVTAVQYAGGDGTEANPYLIKNGNQLYKAATNGGANNYFRLENDIYLNDVSAEKWYEASGLNEWITGGNTFSGHFDGNGYVVHGIYYKDTATERAALFPTLGPYGAATSVTVKNVGIEDSYIQGKYAGAVTAVVDGDRDGNHKVNISCCYADESVFLKGTEANGFVAFLFNYYFTMDNCASRVRMIGTARTDEPIGSLLGGMYLLGTENGATNVDNAKKITIKNSYAVIQKEDRDNGFSVVPQSWTGRHVRYENVHAGVYPDGNGNSIKEGTNFTLNNQESCIFTRWPSDFRKITLPNSNFSSEIWLPGDGANRYMIQKVFNKGQIEESWNGGEAATEGDGSESNPYKIRTAKQLYWAINQGSSSEGKYYQLQNNIEITDTSAENWTENAINWVFPTSQYFAGNLDGNGYVVSGMYAEGTLPALIPTVNSNAGEVAIKNIGIETSVSKGSSASAGALIAKTEGSNYINVSCCYAGEDVILSASSKVGLVAEVAQGHFKMSNCFTLAQQSGGGAFAENQLYYGSLVGDVFGANDYFSTVSITNSYAVESPGYAAVCANWSGARCHFANIYTTTSISPNNAADGKFWNYVPWLIIVVQKEKMKDESAISTMANLDFNDIWMPVKNGYPKQRVFDKSSGGSAANFEGEGTKENPYRIKTAEEMNALRSLSSQQTSGKYYRLENDINFAGITCEMNISASFNGCFDGNGHTISNIVINEPGTGNTALFGKVGNNAVVENLRITNSSFTGKTAAAFIGTVAGENVMISKCFADSTVTVNGSNICGGIVGAISKNSFTMTSCAFTGKIIGGTAETPKAGLVGASTATNVKSTISSSYAATPDNDPAISPVSGTASLRFVGIYSSGVQIFGSADNVSAKIDDLTLSQMTGDNAKTNMPMLDFDSVFVTKTDSTPVLRIFESESVPVIKGTAGKVWSGKIATQYAGGTGAVNDPYLIATGEQLALLASTAVRAPLLTSGVFYKLTDDILLNDTQATEWYNGKNVNQWFYDYSYSSIGFLGHLDGAGHSVIGICNNEAGLCNGKVVLGSYGLFGALGASAVVENVAVKNLYIKNGSGVSGTHAGSIAGFIATTADKEVKIQIKKCVADATNVLSANTNGGILGHACIGVKIENCLSQAIPFARHSNGTIVGVCDSPTATEITNCLVIEGLKDKTVAFWMTDAAWAASQAYPIVTNVYSTFSSTGVPAVGRSKLMGESAKKVLEGFDFDEVWTTVENGTPTLRVFDGRYSQERKKVTISFYTEGGTEVKEVKGYPGEKIPWPDETTIKRDADIFDGWYLEIQHLREYPIDFFPEYDVVLFAKWDVKTITQDFETYPYSDEGFEGLGLDYERYRPGSLGFDFKYVRDGLTSIHRKGTDSDVGESDFAILQDDMEPLEIGREYTLSFWVYVESVGNASDKIKLAHTDYLDVDEPIYYLEDICTLGSLKTGEWQEVTIKFTANAYYIALRTPGMSSMYFDSFKIVPSSSAIHNIENSGISQTGEDITNILITITVMLASAALMIVFRPRRVKE